MTDGWNRRLDPTPLEGGAPIRLDLPCAVAGADGPGLEGLARAGTPLVGEPRRVGGVEMVPATFLWRSARPGTACVALHLNSLTDNHREDLRPALMEPVGATGWWALCCLLPSDGVLSYQVVESASPIPSGTGRTRDGWLAFHMAGLADPHCPGAIANGRAMPASLWHGPSARAHPDWARAHGPDAAGSGVEVVEAVRSRGGGCGARSVELVRGVGRGGAGQEPGVLVLFAAAAGEALVGYREYRGGHDYAWWRYGLSDALDRISAM